MLNLSFRFLGLGFREVNSFEAVKILGFSIFTIVEQTDNIIRCSVQLWSFEAECLKLHILGIVWVLFLLFESLQQEKW